MGCVLLKEMLDYVIEEEMLGTTDGYTHPLALNDFYERLILFPCSSAILEYRTDTNEFSSLT